MNKLRKLIPLTVIVSIFLVANIECSFATPSVYMENLSADGWTTSQWDASVTNMSVMRILTGNDEYLYSYKVLIVNDSATESGTLRGVIFDDIDANHDEVIDGSEPLAFSTNIYSCSNLAGTVADGVWVTFTFDSGIKLNSSQYYAVGMWMEVAGGTDFPWAYTDTGGSTYASDPATKTYTPHPYSPCFQLYTTTSSTDFTGATPGPLPTSGSYTYDSTDDLINTLAGYLVPLLTFLLPAFILGWVTRWQKWPILIGLAIGSGLTYLFLGSQYLWLVVMVIIGIASMSYSDFRSSGGGP